MAYKDLATVEVVEELSENAHVLVEDNGKIVRGDHPKHLGGNGGNGNTLAEEVIINLDNSTLTFNNEVYELQNGRQVIDRQLYEKIDIRKPFHISLVENNQCYQKGVLFARYHNGQYLFNYNDTLFSIESY